MTWKKCIAGACMSVAMVGGLLYGQDDRVDIINSQAGNTHFHFALDNNTYLSFPRHGFMQFRSYDASTGSYDSRFEMYHTAVSAKTRFLTVISSAEGLPHIERDGLIVQNNNPSHGAGLTIVGSRGGNSTVYFTDADRQLSGAIDYSNQRDEMGFFVDGQVQARLLGTGEFIAPSISTGEVTVESDYWPDYVFSNDYKLPSLEEVENHIEKHGHLPGVPSSQEVQEQGLGVSSMMTKQMEKIEELTLYAIEQEKRIEQLEAMIERLAGEGVE